MRITDCAGLGSAGILACHCLKLDYCLNLRYIINHFSILFNTIG
jgi:hypothetical protein